MRQAAQPSSARPRGRRIIERPRLIKLLDDTSARTILLIAPAGYGKTTLARQWAERQPGVHWYTARTGSADVAQLAVDLAAVLEDAAPDLLTYVTQLVQALPNPSQRAARIAERIARAAAALTNETLIIDDFHLIADDQPSSEFVHHLQQRLGLRLLIASRVRPRWATARLQVYGELFELGAEALALNAEEATDVLGKPEKETADILRVACGWPAVVGLAAQANTTFLSRAEGAATTLFRYFAEELFRATSEELQDQLLTLSLLPRLTDQLIEGAIGADPQRIVEEAIESGLASAGEEEPELHPLIREYLLAKLGADANAADRIRSCVLLCLSERFWDHAFSLVIRFEATDLLDHLIEATFPALVASGRIATAEQLAAFGHAVAHVSPLIDLIDAELAFRNGLFDRAEAIAARAARELGPSHSLTSRAWWLAGQGAQLSFENATALSHFARARESAANDADLRDALWGAALTSCQTEDPSAAEAVQSLLSRRDRSAIDEVRATTAEVILERFAGSGRAIRLSDASVAKESIGDPRIRTSFMNACVYYLILRARYDEAHEIAEDMRDTADAYQLTWAVRHAHWALAAIAFGRRRMGEANVWLRRVERAAEEGKFGPLLLNASCLRARQLLALQQPQEAWSALTIDETLPTDPGMRGEFYATKALTLAVLNQPGEAQAWIDRARSVTNCVEARAYSAAARAILAVHTGAAPQKVAELFADVERMATWDAYISTVRAWPALLATLVQARSPTSGAIAALRNAYDFDLSRGAGVDIGRRPRKAHPAGALSRREVEVLDLVRQGFTNQDIARALFISKATVKVHVQHILEKTGARSRTEAAIAEDEG